MTTSLARLTIGAALLLVFAGSFFIGRSTGEDLGAAREDGYAAGKKLGIKKGTASGLAAGREETFPVAYRRSYVSAYKRSYKSEGVDPPKTVKVKVPSR